MVKPAEKVPEPLKSELIEYDPKNKPFWSSCGDSEKNIYYAKQGWASKTQVPSLTILEVFDKAVKLYPDKIAMRYEDMNKLEQGDTPPPPTPLESWKSFTWKAYSLCANDVAKAIIKYGHVQHDGVCIFGFNSPQWFLSCMGCIFAGGKVTGIYPTDSAQQVQYKLFHSNSSIAIVQGTKELKILESIIDELPYLKAIVVWGAPPGNDLKRTYNNPCPTLSFRDFVCLGNQLDDMMLNDRKKKIKASHCCSLVYTSGTTGSPKAVMISHDNLVFESLVLLPIANSIGSKPREERILSYLPLSHVAGAMFDIFFPIICTAYSPSWASTNFARMYDLKVGTLGERLRSVQPTIFFGVPRVWEKMKEAITIKGKSMKGVKKQIAMKAKKKGLIYSTNCQLGGSGKKPKFYGLSNIILKDVQKKLGLDQCRYALSGAAPLKYNTITFFASLGIQIFEIYGMSECTGAATWSNSMYHLWKSVGFQLPGTEVKCFQIDVHGNKVESPKCLNIDDPSEEEQGEICFRGRHIMTGYLANPKLGQAHVDEITEKNVSTIDDEGWLHSGDKGTICFNGMIRITGRYKEIIITAGGENVAPIPIEDEIKLLCPFISNIIMIGDKQKFNICLITLLTVGATGELPGTDELEFPAKQYGETVQEAMDNEELIEAISDAIKKVGDDGSLTPSNCARIQKFSILPADFSIATEEFTPTLKLKRSYVAEKYKFLIDAIYNSDDTYVHYNHVEYLDASENLEENYSEDDDNISESEVVVEDKDDAGNFDF